MNIKFLINFYIPSLIYKIEHLFKRKKQITIRDLLVHFGNYIKIAKDGSYLSVLLENGYTINIEDGDCISYDGRYFCVVYDEQQNYIEEAWVDFKNYNKQLKIQL